MYLIANTLSKLSMVFLVKRIFSHQDSRRAAVFCGTLGAIVAAWGIASTMATSIGCQPVHVMQGDDETCPGAVGVLVLRDSRRYTNKDEGCSLVGRLDTRMRDRGCHSCAANPFLLEASDESG